MTAASIASLLATGFPGQSAAQLRPLVAKPEGITQQSSNLLRIGEGFYPLTADAPEAVRRAWETVFIVLTPKGTGTAFLIHKRNVGSDTEYFFMTNFHIVEETCGAGVCKALQLGQAARGYAINGNLSKVDLSGYHITNLELVHSQAVQDLALLKIRVARNSIPLEPLRLAAKNVTAIGERQYLIGFPALQERYPPQESDKPILVMEKKWSSGLSVGSGSYWGASTVDAIDSNSGGPVVEESGAVVGVISESVNPYSKTLLYQLQEQLSEWDWTGVVHPRFLYYGDETPGHYAVHSFFTGVEAVQAFLKEALEKSSQP